MRKVSSKLINYLKGWSGCVMMNDEQLQKIVEKISITFFQRPFTHKAIFNRRLRTTGGRYMLQSHNIEINPKQYEYFGKSALIGIIKHELCHYHLHLLGKGYRHGDEDFKRLIKEVDAPLHCKVIPGTRNKSRMIRRYKCSNCQLHYERKRKVNVYKYVCGKCKGRLVEL